MRKVKKLKKVRYIIKESFSGKKQSQEIFADIFLSEYEENSSKIWTLILGYPRQAVRKLISMQDLYVRVS